MPLERGQDLTRRIHRSNGHAQGAAMAPPASTSDFTAPMDSGDKLHRAAKHGKSSNATTI
jgi:hypothetical protein